MCDATNPYAYHQCQTKYSYYCNNCWYKNVCPYSNKNSSDLVYRPQKPPPKGRWVWVEEDCESN